MRFKEWFSKMTEEKSHILEYIEFKADLEQLTVEQAAQRSLGRLFGQIKTGENPIIIITAFRHELLLKDNRNRNSLLAQDIRQLGWGYTPVLGGFMETGANNEKIRVHEESFFVNATGPEKQVVNHVVKLLDKYGQEAVLLKLPNNDQAILLLKDGTRSNIGEWHADPQLMATYYTRMRKGPENRQFTFEAAGDDSVMTRRAVHNFQKGTVSE